MTESLIECKFNTSGKKEPDATDWRKKKAGEHILGDGRSIAQSLGIRLRDAVGLQNKILAGSEGNKADQEIVQLVYCIVQFE